MVEGKESCSSTQALLVRRRRTMRSIPTCHTAVSLLAGAILLTGCTSDDRPTVLGPGVVTPGPVRTGEPAPTDSPPPTEPSSSTASGRIDSPATKEPTASSTPSSSVAAAVPRPLRDEDAELDADGQLGDGLTVLVEARITRADGFVAVFSEDGSLLLGAQPIARSNNDRPVTITLDEPISSSTDLVLVLHADNGDGRFDPATDPRVSDDDDETDLEVELMRYRVR